MKRTLVVGLAACLAPTVASAQISNWTGPPVARVGYWDGVARTMATSPNDNVCAVSCHNCYSTASSSPATNLAVTLNLIHDAQAKGADLIELDIKEEGGSILVDHNDDMGVEGAPLGSVLADAGLQGGDQLLFIEIKENTPTVVFATQLVDLLVMQGYATPGRPVVLRAFHSRRDNLILLRDRLALPQYAPYREHFRLQELFGTNDAPDIAGFQALIETTRQDGFHGVEFHYRSSNLFGMLKFAESRGLGTGIYTIPSGFGELYVAALREDVDEITVDYPIDLSRAVVEEDTTLLYIDTWDQSPRGGALHYRRQHGHIAVLPIGGPDDPTLSLFPPGEDLYGWVLDFFAAGNQYLRFYDADNDPGDGYMVTAVVNFDDLSLANGETMEIVGKADSAGFALELRGTGSGTVLRFGVHVNGAYRYSTRAVGDLNTTDSYFITGAYDGNGGVRLWLDNDDAGTSVTTVVGGVTLNDSPVLLGADPQGQTDTRFHFDGKIQQVQVQRWRDH